MNAGYLDQEKSIRCINVINFIRGVEPRFATDLLLPVQRQMEIIRRHELPATWLLQYDALVDPKFTDYLKTNMAKNHEVGFWFEMNEKHCKAADVEWRGRPGYEWDHLPPVAFTIGYTPAERIKLADAAMREFKAIWGKYPSSVASWNLDALTIAHLVETYHVDAFAVCRDQIATDGFTIWGAPIAGYYPSKTNCWSPALTKSNQINAPVFRMLGQDPTHYYNRNYKKPDGKVTSEPDTMEPVWFAGRSEHFIKSFLEMIAESPSMKFGYAQLGQENSFPWRDQEEAYPKQMKALAQLRDAGSVHVETMGDSGRRFKKAFKTTPTQAQVMLEDSFGNTEPAEGSIWYQSRFYRANLHLLGDLPFFRDITVYSDQFPQPYLHEATRHNDVEQRMMPVVDGYHWSPNPGSLEGVGAGGFLHSARTPIRFEGLPTVRELGNSLLVEGAIGNGQRLRIEFNEKEIALTILPSGNVLSLSFEWDLAKAALTEVKTQGAKFRWQEADYAVGVSTGTTHATDKGWTVQSVSNKIVLKLAQDR